MTLTVEHIIEVERSGWIQGYLKGGTGDAFVL
jgi:hypothetical protein